MTIIISIMALFISLIAMWMASNSLKKSDGSVSSFILKARKELSEARDDVDAMVSSMGKRVDTLDQLVSVIQSDGEKSKETIADFQLQLSALRSDLEALDGSIPKQYRKPSPRSAPSQLTQ